MTAPSAWAASTTAFLTDRYELTMLEAALRSGRASCPCDVRGFYPPAAGPPAVGRFRRFGPIGGSNWRIPLRRTRVGWLEKNSVVDSPTLEWLSTYRFSGTVDAYREGELYTGWLTRPHRCKEHLPKPYCSRRLSLAF